MKSRILFVLCLLTGLIFINAGLNKFIHYMPMPKDMPEKVVKAGMAFMEIGMGVLLATIHTTPSGLPMVIILIAVILWTVFDNKEKYLPMIRKQFN